MSSYALMDDLIKLIDDDLDYAYFARDRSKGEAVHALMKIQSNVTHLSICLDELIAELSEPEDGGV